jgi:hypothetical protein
MGCGAFLFGDLMGQGVAVCPSFFIGLEPKEKAPDLAVGAS